MTDIEANLILFLQKNIKDNSIISDLLHIASNSLNIYILIVIIISLYLLDILSNKQIISIVLLILLVVTIKNIVRRRRPFIKHKNIKKLETMKIDKYSFPSGHMAISYLLATFVNNKYFYLFPFIIGISRMYLGVHYLSDLIASIILTRFVLYTVN
jgi:undecaprenyl-diphosphatase